MSHPLPHRKKSFVTNTFKYLLAISSMAGTLGIWTLLANNDLVIAQDKTNGQTAPEANLDPIPTLVPILTIDLSSLQKGGGGPLDVATVVTEAVPLREVARPAASTVVSPIIISGENVSSPSSGNQNAPATTSSEPVVSAPNPVTTTQSSRP